MTFSRSLYANHQRQMPLQVTAGGRASMIRWSLGGGKLPLANLLSLLHSLPSYFSCGDCLWSSGCTKRALSRSSACICRRVRRPIGCLLQICDYISISLSYSRLTLLSAHILLALRHTPAGLFAGLVIDGLLSPACASPALELSSSGPAA